jgi:16S rRNA U516 pseudouridylate synthase RsuA-like enzyme
VKLVRLIANLGYGSRKQVALIFREGRITDVHGAVLYADDTTEHADVRLDGEPLDPPAGLVLMLNKPGGSYMTSCRRAFVRARRSCRRSAAWIATRAACCS